MKRKQLRAVADGYVGDLERAEHAVEGLLLRLGYCRGALVQDGEGGLVQEEAHDGDALLLAQAEQVVPVAG